MDARSFTQFSLFISYRFLHRLFFIDNVVKEMKKLFDIPENEEVRLWNKFMHNTYELLVKTDNTLQDHGYGSGQVHLLFMIYTISLSMKYFILYSLHYS